MNEDDVADARTGEMLEDETTVEASLPPDIEVLTRRNEVQLSIGLGYTRSARLENLRRQINRAIGLPVELSMGLGRGFELSVGTSVNYGEREALLLDGQTSDSETRFGDLSFGLAYQLRNQSANAPGISASLSIGVPLEESDGEADESSVGLNLSFSRNADPMLLFWSIGYASALNEGKADGVRTRSGDSFSYGFGFSFVVNNTVSIDTRFSGSFSRDLRVDGVTQKGSGNEPMYLATALTYRSGKGRRWRVGVTNGLNDDAGDVEISLSHLRSF